MLWIDSFCRCRNKIHKEHVDNNDPLAPCKLHHDPHSAREMLLLASTPDEQNLWVSRLSKRIQKCGYKANSSSNNNSNNTDGSKISPRWVDSLFSFLSCCYTVSLDIGVNGSSIIHLLCVYVCFVYNHLWDICFYMY